MQLRHPDRPRGQVSGRRHGRVPHGCRHRLGLFHRGQSAHPGRAHRHRTGDRHRHRQGADPLCRGRRHRRPAAGLRAAPGRYPPQWPRAPVPHHHRGPGTELHSRLRPHHRLSRRHRLRHQARRRHRLFRRGHHPLLRSAPGKGDRLGAVGERGDRAHEPGVARVPHPRRGDQPVVPGKRHRPSALPGRQLHHALHRRDAGTLPVDAPARPRHQAAHLHRRRDGQRAPGHQEPAASAGGGTGGAAALLRRRSGAGHQAAARP